MQHESNLTREERDLLVELRTEMKAVRADIKEIKDNTSFRINQLEQGKIDNSEAMRLKSEADKIHGDFETRLRFIERYLWAALGILAIIQFIGFSFFFNQLSK